MDLSEGSIITGDFPVLVQAANGDQKVINLKTADKNMKDIRLGKIKLPLTQIIGQKYGSTICPSSESRGWERIQGSEVWGVCDEVSGDEETEAMSDTNEDDENGESHETGHSRAAASAANNPAFLAKSKFSQEKYLKKKQKKFSKEVKLLKPSLKDFCESGIPPIRADMLGSLLRFSAIRDGSRVALIDDVLGIVTTGLLERGCVVDRFVFGRATGQERAQCAFGLEKSKNLSILRNYDEVEPNALYDSLVVAIATSAETTIQDAFDALHSKLKPCGTLVCYSRTIEPLLALLYKLRTPPTEGQETRFINVQLTEQMMREHEIVKERTHPIMTQSIGLFQGFLLSAIKVSEQV